MTEQNPFTERGRITRVDRFAGRWSELSLIFDRIEAGRPVLISGTPGIGKSSLLTHISQSAAVNLELPDLHSYYLDVALAPNAAVVYQTLIEALGQRGTHVAALEVAIIATGAPVLICLDNLHEPLADGWGDEMLEALARIVRGGGLMLVAALDGQPPLLSERFAQIGLGALAPTEIGLLVEAYLDGTGVSFSPRDLRDLADLSASHPAYLQRAAYHLFQNKLGSGVNWRAAYLEEAHTRPIPGAPLPPEVFAGEQNQRVEESSYGAAEDIRLPAPELSPTLDITPLLIVAPILLGAILLITTGNFLLALLIATGGVFGANLWIRQSRQ